ncbi:hypothetical protein SLEP1_g40195 [Rubroshorea leprosula]|uniref:glutathione transferase n=1 Tax=Rubroshorea leprosula TaxID=152421 RepID=A0AAV5L408_9ROSI|nr:hypothetical protein SLEP1_g40195 [Rubroshorea leprosula]
MGMSSCLGNHKHLTRKYKDTVIDLLGSDDFIESTIVDTWMEVEAHHCNEPMSKIFREMLVNPINGMPSDDKIIEAEVEKLGKVLDVYEERLSKFKYLAGDYYTLADLHHIPYLVYLMRSRRPSRVTSPSLCEFMVDDFSTRSATVKVAENMTL